MSRGASAVAGAAPWLALSVQASRTSAAIGTRAGVLAEAQDADPAPGAGPPDRQASRATLVVVAACLSRAGLGLHDLAGLCVANGPGAFTALRVAISVVQGIGIATRLPVIAVPSLAALAVAATADDRDDDGGDPPPEAARRLVLTAIDARMRECYFAAWEVGAARPVAVSLGDGRMTGAVGDGDAAVARFEAVLEARASASSGLILAGSGFETEPALRRWQPTAVGGRPVRRLATLEADAVAVLVAALGDGTAGLDDDWPPVAAADLRPRYLRDKVALDIDEQRALAARRDASSSRT